MDYVGVFQGPSIYGVALVLFTLIVRVCLVPLSIKQQKIDGKNADFPAAYGGNTEKYANNREKNE